MLTESFRAKIRAAMFTPEPGVCQIEEEWGGLFIGRKSCSTHQAHWDGPGDCPGPTADVLTAAREWAAATRAFDPSKYGAEQETRLFAAEDALLTAVEQAGPES